MKRQFVVSLGAVALLAFSLGAQPALCNQNPATDSSAAFPQQAEPAQAGEVQAELAKAQAELARAMQEVTRKAVGHQSAQPRVAALRGAMLADLQARQGELAALVQEKITREITPLRALEESESGWLGVQIADVDAQKAKELKLPAERGVLISEVEKDSPAAKAGLQVNDVVTEFNGQRIESATQFRRMVRESLAGRAAQLTLWRPPQAGSQSLSVTLGSPPAAGVERSFRIFRDRDFHFDFSLPEIDILVGSRAPILGISADDISGQLGAYFGAPGGEGILVREIHSGSPAEKAGMKAGDVITKLDGERVRSLSELREKLRAKREQKSASVGVIRKGAEVSLTVEIEQPRPPERRRIMRRSALQVFFLARNIRPGPAEWIVHRKAVREHHRWFGWAHHRQPMRVILLFSADLGF